METGVGTLTGAGPAARAMDGDGARGWYLYGITRCSPVAETLAEEAGGVLLELAELAAVVRAVPLADFDAAVLQERLQSASALEEMVRSHNRVIEAVHARQAILPAKFGSVYARAEDVVQALGSARDTLLRQLEELEGCDEWAVHLFVDRAAVRERISTEDETVARLRAEHAAARPGRAYFLERQIRDELEGATQEALMTLAQRAFDRLAGNAVAAQLSPPEAGADPAGETEILRASFLVAREGAERFEEELHSVTGAGDCLRCEYSGPWPPYSFAARDQEGG